MSRERRQRETGGEESWGATNIPTVSHHLLSGNASDGLLIVAAKKKKKKENVAEMQFLPLPFRHPVRP